MEKKPKIIRDKLKDKIINDFWALFNTKKEKEERKKKKLNNYIEYESNGDKSRNLSLDECHNKIGSYLRNMIINLQINNLTIAINFIS